MLAMLLAVALLGVAWGRRAPLRLIWRTRWLLGVLLLGYGFSLPGDALWPALADWSPTRQGLAMGAQYAVRLMTLLLWLDLLVLQLPPQALLAGLYALMAPGSLLGLDSQRLALRLALTLQAIEALEHQGGTRRGNLRRLLLADAQADAALPDRIVLRRYPARWPDVVVPMAVLLALLGLWLKPGASP